MFKVLRGDETVIGPRQRVAYWSEVVETTRAGDALRTYRQTGRRFVRLVLPVPEWVARVLRRQEDEDA